MNYQQYGQLILVIKITEGSNFEMIGIMSML